MGRQPVSRTWIPWPLPRPAVLTQPLPLAQTCLMPCPGAHHLTPSQALTPHLPMACLPAPSRLQP